MSTVWKQPPAPPKAHRKNAARKKKPAAEKPAEAVFELPARLKNKVAIVGFAPHNTQTPFADDTWEIWGINRLYSVLQGRFDRWFEIHALEDYETPEHVEWLKQFHGEIFLRSADLHLHDLP